jgi:hypothetical protein
MERALGQASDEPDAVKELDKQYLREQQRRAGNPAPRVIGIDEIAIAKGHQYRIVQGEILPVRQQRVPLPLDKAPVSPREAGVLLPADLVHRRAQATPASSISPPGMPAAGALQKSAARFCRRATIADQVVSALALRRAFVERSRTGSSWPGPGHFATMTATVLRRLVVQ